MEFHNNRPQRGWFHCGAASETEKFSSSQSKQLLSRNDGGKSRKKMPSQARTPLHLLELSKLLLAHFQQLIPSPLRQLAWCLISGFILSLNTDTVNTMRAKANKNFNRGRMNSAASSLPSYHYFCISPVFPPDTKTNQQTPHFYTANDVAHWWRHNRLVDGGSRPLLPRQIIIDAFAAVN